MMSTNEYEVIIIGGSYAGLSAAMALGRSLRRVLVIDSGLPCNRQTPRSHNFITQDGELPENIAREAKEQVLRYNTVTFLQDLAKSAQKTEKGFRVATQNGLDLFAKKLVFATGVKDQMPNIKGFTECWGISIIHCPYCHGYEFRHQKTGVMANGERAFHLASLINNLTNDLTILTAGKAEFTEEQLKKLNNHKIKVIETAIAEMEHENGHLKNVRFDDGQIERFAAVYAAIPFIQHSDLPLQLGCETTELGHLKVDSFQKTTVDGVFACGDNSSLMRSVANAVSSGNMVGAVVNRMLTDELF